MENGLQHAKELFFWPFRFVNLTPYSKSRKSLLPQATKVSRSPFSSWLVLLKGALRLFYVLLSSLMLKSTSSSLLSCSNSVVVKNCMIYPTKSNLILGLGKYYTCTLRMHQHLHNTVFTCDVISSSVATSFLSSSW